MLTICLKISCTTEGLSKTLPNVLMAIKINIYQKKLCLQLHVASLTKWPFAFGSLLKKKCLYRNQWDIFFPSDCTEKGLRKHGYYLIYDSRSCRWTNRCFLLWLSSLCVRACVRVESAAWARGDRIQLQKQDHTVCPRIVQIFESFIVLLNIWDCYWLWGLISGKRVSRHPG